jgi:hypothetical protein
MITKILRPSKTGKVVYNNKGSSGRLVNYLEHEAKELNEKAVYFNQACHHIAGPEVVERIDNNRKGLRQEDAKFYSIVISPSEQELQHLGNNSKGHQGYIEKLQAYTRKVMENYAENFKLKGNKKLESNQLIWFATIHHHRVYNGRDMAVKEGTAKSGEAKLGCHTHIHVIISRRDQTQKISLTPNGSKQRFSIQEWQQQNALDFGYMFGYEKQTYYSQTEQKEQRLRKRLEQYIQAQGLSHTYLNPDKIVRIGKEQGFDWKFYRNLRSFEKAIQDGLRPLDPYERFQFNQGKSPTKTMMQDRPLSISSEQTKVIIPQEQTKESRQGTRQSILATIKPTSSTVASQERAYKACQKENYAGKGGGKLAVIANIFSALARSTDMPGKDTEWSNFPQCKRKKKNRKWQQGREF